MTTMSDLYVMATHDLDRKFRLEQDRAKVLKELTELNQELVDTLTSQKLLSVVSEENTVNTLNYITSVLNKVLGDIFQGSVRKVYLEKKLHNNRYSHIVVKLQNGQGQNRDLKLQTGSGIKEVISFLFSCSFVMIRGGRKLMVFDEVLSGLHPEALSVVQDLMEIFEAQGMQFIHITYGLDNIGTMYNVENPNGSLATLVPIEGTYHGERFVEVAV